MLLTIFSIVMIYLFARIILGDVVGFIVAVWIMLGG